MTNVIIGTVTVIMLLVGSASAPAQDASHPRCEDAKEAGKAKSPGMWRVPCWMEVSNQPKCEVLVLQSNTRKVAWDGACVSNAAHGTGVFRRMPHRSSEYMTEERGAMVSGKRYGAWVVRGRNASVPSHWAGSWAVDKLVAEGSYVDGLAQGHWVLRWDSGPKYSGSSEGPMVDGRRHGPWVTRRNNGDFIQGSYINGKKHGHWVERLGRGLLKSEGSYVNGRRHGLWVVIRFQKDVERIQYIHGKQQ